VADVDDDRAAGRIEDARAVGRDQVRPLGPRDGGPPLPVPGQKPDSLAALGIQGR
jgi:hypothetical protein